MIAASATAATLSGGRPDSRATAAANLTITPIEIGPEDQQGVADLDDAAVEAVADVPAHARVERELDLGDCLAQQVPERVQTPVGGPEPGLPEQTGQHASRLGPGGRL